jgi:hypothetical protein
VNIPRRSLEPADFTFGKIAANSSAIPIDVTDSVQAWVNGAPNHGWVRQHLSS